VKFSKLNREKLFLTKNQIHTAIQLISIPPRSYLPQSDGDIYASLIWDARSKSLHSQHFGNLKNIQTSINIKKFELEILVEEIVFDAIDMDNRTYEYLYDWLKNKLVRLQLDPSQLSTKLPYILQEIEISPESKLINYDSASLQEFAKFYQNAYLSFVRFQNENLEKKYKILVWPHHFDMALNIPLDPSGENQIGIGLSPGDQYYPEPYFYVLLPTGNYAEKTKSVTPIVGSWHTKKWNGLVLLASEFILETEHLQERIIVDFLKNAYDISKKVLI